MIDIAGLTKSYGRRCAIDDVTFSVNDGRIVGFIGPNGAGKSTTMRAALELESADAGTATFDGRPYSDLDFPLTHVGSILDAKSLPPDLRVGDVLTYCALSQRLSPRDARRALHEVGLADAAKKRVRHLSLGMRQRLGIAVALLGDAGNLVLDEPLNGLDPSGIMWVRTLLLERKERGAAILLSSHLMSELALVVDDVVIIDQGVIRLRSSMHELTQRGLNRVHVASPQAQQLADAATHLGAETVEISEHRAVLASISPRAVFRLAVDCGIELDELRAESASLDEVYREVIDVTGGESS